MQNNWEYPWIFKLSYNLDQGENGLHLFSTLYLHSILSQIILQSFNMISGWHVGSARGEAVSGIVKTELDRNELFSMQAFLFKQRSCHLIQIMKIKMTFGHLEFLNSMKNTGICWGVLSNRKQYCSKRVHKSMGYKRLGHHRGKIFVSHFFLWIAQMFDGGRLLSLPSHIHIRTA